MHGTTAVLCKIQHGRYQFYPTGLHKPSVRAIWSVQLPSSILMFFSLLSTYTSPLKATIQSASISLLGSDTVIMVTRHMESFFSLLLQSLSILINVFSTLLPMGTVSPFIFLSLFFTISSALGRIIMAFPSYLHHQSASMPETFY